MWTVEEIRGLASEVLREWEKLRAIEPVGCSCDKCLCLWPTDLKYCGECGNELHKPEPPEPLIVNSESECDYTIRLMKESIEILEVQDNYSYLNAFTGDKLNIIKDRIQRLHIKPITEPMIVKSGEALIVEDIDGINYIWTSGSEPNPKPTSNMLKQSSVWKSFTGDYPDITELTDEIAKLRPMVTFDGKELAKLIYTEKTLHTVIVHQNDSDRIEYFDHWAICRLATAHELDQK